MTALVWGLIRTLEPVTLVGIGMLLRGAIAVQRERYLEQQAELAQERLLEAKDEIGHLRAQQVRAVPAQHPSHRRPALSVVKDQRR